MRLVVDGIIYQIQAWGGISRIYNEILPRMCQLDPALKIDIVVNRRPKQPAPEHPHISEFPLYGIDHAVETMLRPHRLWRTPSRMLRQQLKLRKLRQIIGGGQGSIWHSTYYTLPPEWAGRQVVTIVDMIYERFPDLFEGAEFDAFREQKRQCVQAADAIICISETTAQDVVDVYGTLSQPIFVTHLAGSSAFKPLSQVRDSAEEPYLLYVGTRTNYKNFSQVLDAYRVWSERGRVRLVVVGGAWTAEEKEKIAQGKLEDRIGLITATDDDALCQLYNGALAFIYPSLYEGFGIPLLEAMLSECPIIASRIPSTVEVAEEFPIYFEPDDVEGLVAAYDQALRLTAETAHLAQAYDHARSYSWDITAQKTLEVYRAVSAM